MNPFKRLTKDVRGVATIEFALIAPGMIALYFGVAEVAQAQLAEQKVTHVASTIGDLAAQSSTITASQVDDLFNIGGSLLAPYSSTGLKMRLTSVTVGSNNATTVVWSQASGLTAYTKNATITLPPSSTNAQQPFIASGQTVILAESQYSWTSPIGYFFPNATAMKGTYYLYPRQSTAVTCADC